MKKVLALVFVVFLSASVFPGQNYLNDYTKGNDLFKENKFLEAAEYLNKALADYPEHIPSLKLLGEIYTRLNRYEEAIIYFKKALVLNPKDIEARINLADVLAWKGELDRAIGLYIEVKEDEPENISAQLGLARVLRWAQRYEEAKDQYLRIVQVHPQNIDALRGLSSTYALLSMYSEAIRTISSAISYSQDNPELYRQKGEILSWQNRFQEAEQSFQKSLNLDAADPETYQSLGNLYAWNKKYKLAVEAYDKAFQIEPENVDHLLDYAKSFILWKKTYQAERMLKKVLKLEPQNIQALKLIQEIKQKPKFDLLELIERVIEPALILSIMIIIFFYFHKKIDILRQRHRYYWIFTRYLLPILLCLGFLVFGLTLWSDVLEPYTEVATEILELSIMCLLCLAFISLLLLKKNNGPVKRNVLVIGAHPDDIELGCGGTIAKLKHDKAKVYAMILSLGEKGGAELEKRIKEARAAAEYLNLNNIWLFNFPDTKLQENINSIIPKIENVIKKAKITTIFTHSPDNIHQDHRAVHESCKVAARGDISVVCYEDIRVDQEFIPNYFVDITEFIDVKLKLIKIHKSQRGKPYMDLDSIKGRAAHRGLQSGVKYAEAFLSYKMVDK